MNFVCYNQLDIESNKNDSSGGQLSAIGTQINPDTLRQVIEGIVSQNENSAHHNEMQEELAMQGTSTGGLTFHGSELLIRNLSTILAKNACKLAKVAERTGSNSTSVRGN